MRLNLDDLYLDILIKELNKGNLDGMKSEALAYRDKFLNEKSLQLKREWKRDAAFVSGSTVSSLAIPASGIVLTTAYLTDKFSYVAKEMGLKSFQKAAVGVGASTFVEEKCNEILDQIMEDCIKEMFTDAVFDIIPGLSLLLLFSKWTSHRQNVTGMIDKLQEKAKRYHHDVIEKCHERVMNGQIFQTNSLSDGVHGFPSDVEKKVFQTNSSLPLFMLFFDPLCSYFLSFSCWIYFLNFLSSKLLRGSRLQKNLISIQSLITITKYFQRRSLLS